MLLVVFGILSLATPLRSLEEPFVHNKDFVQEFILAHAVLERANPYVPVTRPRELARRYIPDYPAFEDPAPAALLPTPHPPTVGLILIPMSFLSFVSAARLWLALETLLLVLSIQLLARAFGRRLSPLATIALSAAALVWHPLVPELALGQLTLAQLPLLAGVALSLRSRRATVAGVLLGITLTVKPSLCPILLAFVLRRQWSPVAAALATLAVVWDATALLIGIDAIVAYATWALPVVAESYKAAVWNISLGSIGWKLFQGTGSAMALGESAPPLTESALAAQLLSVALPAAALLLACYYVSRLPGTAWAFGLMICIGILVSPIAWSFYLILALIPIAQVVEWLVRHHFPVQETNAALVVAMLLLLPPEAWATLLTPSLGPLLPATMGDPAPFVQMIAHLGPAVALVALAALVAALGMRDHRWTQSGGTVSDPAAPTVTADRAAGPLAAN
ncbi:MAG: glycosyltransferase family 87 protein [Chloroflexota bacterium]